jgi:hypothetical protein
MNRDTTTRADFLRANELPERFPVLGRSTWNAHITAGRVRSFKVGRARVVRVADVIAFLEGHSAEVAQ